MIEGKKYLWITFLTIISILTLIIPIIIVKRENTNVNGTLTTTQMQITLKTTSMYNYIVSQNLHYISHDSIIKLNDLFSKFFFEIPMYLRGTV